MHGGEAKELQIDSVACYDPQELEELKLIQQRQKDDQARLNELERTLQRKRSVMRKIEKANDGRPRFQTEYPKASEPILLQRVESDN